ncbi:MAG: hypothetical protein JO101_00965 [Candidatus Eremiobacteraeota bacterium]|nr:hypothetical protein [Candidatus Eremiobacteraeota bacterium]MBV8353861.1 hypothetical protein [Candidatus Eremiobacteraeota bacterium]
MKRGALLLTAILLGAIALGAIEIVSDAATGGVASRVSFPAWLAANLGAAPAQALIERFTGAGSTARDVLEGRLALARGDEATASRLLVAAGDAVATRALVDRIDAAGDYARARDTQRALVLQLEGAGGNRTVRADALWRLGQLDAEVGYREPPHRALEWRRALDDYRRALELVPLSVTILLAAGNQALLLGDRHAAIEYFERALASDPASIAAREGLQRAR